MGSSIKARAVCIMMAGARAACLTLILGRWGAPGGLNRHYWKNCRRHVKLRQLKAKTSLLHAWLLKADLLAAAVCAKDIKGTFEKTSDLNEGKNNLGYFSWCWVHSPRHLQTLSHLSGALRLNLLTWSMSNANSDPVEGFRTFDGAVQLSWRNFLSPCSWDCAGQLSRPSCNSTCCHTILEELDCLCNLCRTNVPCYQQRCWSKPNLKLHE